MTKKLPETYFEILYKIEKRSFVWDFYKIYRFAILVKWGLSQGENELN